MLYGDIEVVICDDRPDSPARGLVSKVRLGEHERRLMNIPPNENGIWSRVCILIPAVRAERVARCQSAGL